jgi:hypothetical protein
MKIKDNGLSRMPPEDPSYGMAQRFGHRPESYNYTVLKLDHKRGARRTHRKAGMSLRRWAKALARYMLPV